MRTAGRTELASEPDRTELEPGAEPVGQRRVVTGGQQRLEFGARVGVGVIGQPGLGLLSVIDTCHEPHGRR